MAKLIVLRGFSLGGGKDVKPGDILEVDEGRALQLCSGASPKCSRAPVEVKPAALPPQPERHAETRIPEKGRHR